MRTCFNKEVQLILQVDRTLCVPYFKEILQLGLYIVSNILFSMYSLKLVGLNLVKAPVHLWFEIRENIQLAIARNQSSLGKL